MISVHNSSEFVASQTRYCDAFHITSEERLRISDSRVRRLGFSKALRPSAHPRQTVASWRLIAGVRELPAEFGGRDEGYYHHEPDNALRANPDRCNVIAPSPKVHILHPICLVLVSAMMRTLSSREHASSLPSVLLGGRDVVVLLAFAGSHSLLACPWLAV